MREAEELAKRKVDDARPLQKSEPPLSKQAQKTDTAPVTVVDDDGNSCTCGRGKRLDDMTYEELVKQRPDEAIEGEKPLPLTEENLSVMNNCSKETAGAG